MKKLLTAICSMALVATMGFGFNAFAELDQDVTGSTTVTIEAVDLSGTASFALGYTVNPQAETLAGIWSASTITVTNTSAAPIFYVYTSASQTGVVLQDLETPFVEPDDGVATDASSISWAAMPAATDFSAITDEQWTNIGVTKTRTDWWLGDIYTPELVEVRTRIEDIFTGEGAGVHSDNILASKWADGAFSGADTITDSLTIRTGTSFASAVVVSISVVITLELTAG
ncbi:MAG: hypothetical protein WCX32_04485 [Clostridia bacterium]